MSKKFLLLTFSEYESQVVVNIDNVSRIYTDGAGTCIEMNNAKAFHVKEPFDQLKNLVLELSQ